MAGKATPSLNPDKKLVKLPSVNTHTKSVTPTHHKHGSKPAHGAKGTPKGL